MAENEDRAAATMADMTMTFAAGFLPLTNGDIEEAARRGLAAAADWVQLLKAGITVDREDGTSLILRHEGERFSFRTSAR